MRTKINIVLGKKGGYISSSLSSRPVSVGRQAGSKMKFLQLDNFNSVNYKVKLICFNSFMVLIARYKEIYGLYLKEMLLLDCFWAIFCLFRSHRFPCRSLLLSTNIPNDYTYAYIYIYIYIYIYVIGPAKIVHICTQNLTLFLNFNLQYLLQYKCYYNEIFIPYSQINKKAKKASRTWIS